MTEPREPAVVLVVEDEPILRMMAVDMVEEAGFEVEEAANAAEAVAILERRPGIRIVFADLAMPGTMDGMRLAAAIRGRWPPIEIILTSGHYARDAVTLPARGAFFAKPYDRRAVVATMRRMAP
ncbi:Sensor kinase CckA [Methylobacterium crusticola]|uniref:Sensor kinase CckA n=1 Tax=Methylobacterium crusticola TaxID=1697972 RepID=A0ABQ4R387_9HYPH|nr:response regulator [Methylobacterium crusticola]GJD51217.1 Sensor kinase CckA [Methylobacterium crusticola]